MFPIEIYCIILSYCSELDIINFSKTSKLGQEVLNKIKKQVILKNLNSIIDSIIFYREFMKRRQKIFNNIRVTNFDIINELMFFAYAKNNLDVKTIDKFNLDEIKKYKSIIIKYYDQKLLKLEMFLSLEFLGCKFLVESHLIESRRKIQIIENKLNNNLIKFSILTVSSLFLARKLYKYLN